MTSAIPDLTIIIPVRDDRRIARCLASIHVRCPVLIALNGATAEFAKWLRSIASEATVIECPSAGLGLAYNAALEACTTEFALLMDSDCVFSPGCIERLYRGLRSAPLSKGRVVFARDGFGTTLVARYRDIHTSSFVNAYSPPLAMSRTIVRRFLGGFFRDELAWAEDFEFDLRVRKRGLRIEYDPEATVAHPPVSIEEDLRAAYRYGMGQGTAERLQILAPRAKSRLGAAAAAEWRYLARIRSIAGFLTVLYAVAWNTAFRLGRRRALRA